MNNHLTRRHFFRAMPAGAAGSELARRPASLDAARSILAELINGTVLEASLQGRRWGRG